VTLIAQLSAHGIPIMLGDLLVTADWAGEERGAIPVPAMPDINKFLAQVGAKFSVVGLFQKINRLSDRLFVATSGDFVQVGKMLSRLSVIANDAEITFELVDKMVSSIDAEERDNVFAIIFVIRKDSDGKIRDWFSINYRVGYANDDELGTISVSGSGREQFLRRLSEIKQRLNNMYGSYTAINNALAASILFEHNFIDKSSSQFLEAKFGGGFEVLAYDDCSKQFNKIGDYVTLTAIISEVENGDLGISIVPIFNHVFYVDDVYFSNVMEYSISSNGECEILRQDLLYALPINFSASIDILAAQQKINNTPWRYMAICCMIRRRETITTFNRIYYKQTGVDSFVFKKEANGDFFMAIKSTIIAQLLTDARNIIKLDKL
jgi:hypothetical protein